MLRPLRLALRRLRRHPVYATLNGVGLAIGLAVFLLISLYVYHEHTYDSYHPDADRIVRFTVSYGSFGPSLRVPAQTAMRVADAYPEIEAVARLYPEDVALRIEDRRSLEEDFLYADPSVFDLFSLPLRRGSPDTALDAPDTVVLTEATARRLFGTTDVMGRTLQPRCASRASWRRFRRTRTSTSTRSCRTPHSGVRPSPTPTNKRSASKDTPTSGLRIRMRTPRCRQSWTPSPTQARRPSRTLPGSAWTTWRSACSR
jgi:hypothetical protein